MEPKYTFEQLRIYYNRYTREYRAISVLWGLLTIIWCILNVVCFVQPHWIGDTPSTESKYGHIGTYKHCTPDLDLRDGKYRCEGSFGNFATILNDSLRATTFFIGLSALIMLITVACLLLFACLSGKKVFLFCGILEVISALCMFIGCVIFPNGWAGPELLDLCGPRVDRYRLGGCGIRWAYILAIVGIFDAIILAILAFVLSSKSATLEGSRPMSTSGTVTKSVFNGYANDTLPKNSVPIQPMVVIPDNQDAYSEYSHRSGKSKRSGLAL